MVVAVIDYCRSTPGPSFVGTTPASGGYFAWSLRPGVKPASEGYFAWSLRPGVKPASGGYFAWSLRPGVKPASGRHFLCLSPFGGGGPAGTGGGPVVSAIISLIKSIE